ncbi:MAG TPA: hypothetical protein VKX17_19275 [Planctomycetota bacterium]|nr:hypothetical protein [Planctomycetota bacterium]
MDSSPLFLSLFISTIGFGYFMYGRKAQEYSFLFAGVIMMFFSYFVNSFWLSLAIGIVLAVAPFFVR